MNISIDSRTNDETRRQELYRGSVFVLSPSASALNFAVWRRN